MDNNLGDYCRLCADLKQTNVLINMETNTEKCQEIVNKLTRFNIHVDFNTKLPKTVCLECMNSLERAYDFVTTVDLAQEAFEDYDSSPKNDEDEDATMGDSNKDEISSIKPQETALNKEPEESTGKDEIKNDAITDLEENSTSNSKSKKEIDSLKKGTNTTRKRRAKSKALEKVTTHKHRKKTKISTNVDRQTDTWYDYNWLCAFCDKYFLTPSELKIHSMQYHYTCNPYRCFDCRGRGLHMDNFITHITKHRPVLTRICYKCNLKCGTLKEMKTHKATHWDTDYVCIGCNTYFNNQDDLDEHTRAFYKNTQEANSAAVKENDSLKCVLCKKSSKSRALLNRHLLIHTERKRGHVCETCGDSFYNRKELNQHVTVHSDSRPYKCEICKFTFKIKYDLKRHAAVHFGTKRFTCEQCGKCFRLCKELLVHSAIHKDTRPYKCSHCNNSFRFRHLMIQHLRLHAGVRPYPCDICPLTFRNWSNFNKHTRDVHGVDHSKRKHTSGGLYAVDPKTNEVIYPDMDKVLEWKKKILEDRKKGRPKRKAKERKTVTEPDKKSKG